MGSRVDGTHGFVCHLSRVVSLFHNLPTCHLTFPLPPPTHTHTTYRLPTIRRQTGRIPQELGENENDEVSYVPPPMKPPDALNKFSLYNTHTHTHYVSVYFPPFFRRVHEYR